jgi:hypothetical protein
LFPRGADADWSGNSSANTQQVQLLDVHWQEHAISERGGHGGRLQGYEATGGRPESDIALDQAQLAVLYHQQRGQR